VLKDLLNLSEANLKDKEQEEFDREFDSVNRQEQMKDDLDNAEKAIQSVDSISFVHLNSHFRNHSLIADKINSISNLGWKAHS